MYLLQLKQQLAEKECNCRSLELERNSVQVFCCYDLKILDTKTLLQS